MSPSSSDSGATVPPIHKLIFGCVALVCVTAIAAILLLRQPPADGKPAEQRHAAGEAVPPSPSVQDLKAAILEKENAGELGFRVFEICFDATAYGVYTPSRDRKFVKGSTANLYFEIDNLSSEHVGNQFRRSYTEACTLRNEKGEVVLENDAVVEYDATTGGPVLDLFGVNPIGTAALEPGTYEFTATIHDRIRNRKISKSLKFDVWPSGAEPLPDFVPKQ